MNLVASYSNSLTGRVCTLLLLADRLHPWARATKKVVVVLLGTTKRIKKRGGIILQTVKRVDAKNNIQLEK